MIELKKEAERVILVAVSVSSPEDADRSLDELSALADTAGAVEVGRLIQALPHINTATYIGKGKVEELREQIEQTKADGVICDDELSPAQMRNLSDALSVKIMDRTMVILDIFASRAATREGAIQVEMAQLQYRLSRLSGQGNALSRLGGGIGTRGPGETRLEVDRRVIKDRIAQLGKELDDVKRHRELTRKERKKSALPVCAIVGYTNAGKSTLLNALTDADILVEDQLFATLDPTTRSYTLPSGQQVLLTDTVGFIRKLPHHLIDAFQSTLEEAKYADLLLHVVDASNPQMEAQMQTVYETLADLEVKGKPILTVFNKQDQVKEPTVIRDFKADETVQISAKTGTGLPKLADALERLLREQKVYLEQCIPYDEAGRIQLIRQYGELLEESYSEAGIFVRAYVPADLYHRYFSY